MRTVNENCKREVRGKREVNARLFQEVLSDKVLNISYSSYATRKREFEYFEGRGDTQLLNDATATPPCTLQWAEAEGHAATVALIRQHV